MCEICGARISKASMARHLRKHSEMQTATSTSEALTLTASTSEALALSSSIRSCGKILIDPLTSSETQQNNRLRNNSPSPTVMERSSALPKDGSIHEEQSSSTQIRDNTPDIPGYFVTHPDDQKQPKPHPVSLPIIQLLTPSKEQTNHGAAEAATTSTQPPNHEYVVTLVDDQLELPLVDDQTASTSRSLPPDETSVRAAEEQQLQMESGMEVLERWLKIRGATSQQLALESDDGGYVCAACRQHYTSWLEIQQHVLNDHIETASLEPTDSTEEDLGQELTVFNGTDFKLDSVENDGLGLPFDDSTI